MKTTEAPKVNWKEKFFDVKPAVGPDGEPLRQNPPINKEGFWDKPKHMFNEEDEDAV